jgi:hypothetical protein
MTTFKNDPMSRPITLDTTTATAVIEDALPDVHPRNGVPG